MATHEIPLLVDSSPAAGALNVSADGSQFEINLEDPIAIPSSAMTCTVEVQEATVWWVTPNITTGVNDAFSIDDGGGPYNITVPQGLYDLITLQASVDSAVVAAGGPSGLFQFIADSATQKVVIRLIGIGVSVDFTIANSFRDILGFNSQVLGPTVVAQTDFLGDNQAAFNQINYFLIHSDLVNRGIRQNNTYDQTIAQVLIDVPPGSQIISRPFNPPKSPAWDLIAAKKKRIRFWLTDDQNRPVETVGESWSARVIIAFTHSVEEETNDRINRFS